MFPIIIWPILFSIGVSDAKEHRIPNKLLLLVLFFCLLDLGLHWSLDLFFDRLLAGITMFILGLFLFFAKAMSAGDVKLLGVIGILVGWVQLPSVGYWIIISAGVVGVFYSIYNSIESPSLLYRIKKSANELTIKQVMLMLITRNVAINKTVMPFAPIVVIGLALHSYFA